MEEPKDPLSSISPVFEQGVWIVKPYGPRQLRLKWQIWYVKMLENNGKHLGNPVVHHHFLWKIDQIRQVRVLSAYFQTRPARTADCRYCSLQGMLIAESSTHYDGESGEMMVE